MRLSFWRGTLVCKNTMVFFLLHDTLYLFAQTNTHTQLFKRWVYSYASSGAQQFMGYESPPQGRSDVQERDTLMNSQFIVLSSSACLLGNCGSRDSPADCQTCALADDQSTWLAMANMLTNREEKNRLQHCMGAWKRGVRVKQMKHEWMREVRVHWQRKEWLKSH